MDIRITKSMRRVLAYVMVCCMMATTFLQFSLTSVFAAAAVTFTKAEGYEEGAYAQWQPVAGADGYVAYVSADGVNFTKVDNELIRGYDGYYRVDVLGIKGNSNCVIKVEAVTLDADKKVTSVVATGVTSQLSVKAYDRAGFGFVNGTSSGAYNEDGTLRDGAVVLYVTEANIDTITLDVVTAKTGATTTEVGIANILTGYKSGYDKRPLDIRVIGLLTNNNCLETAKDFNGDFLISGSGSEAAKRLSAGITLEGVGEDAVAYGWGARIKNSSNVEVRNIGFMLCDSGEKDDVGLQQDNDHVWVHNCDMFYGMPGKDSDQVKGDGSLDCKKSTYITFSYNHFWDSGKCNLLGLSENTNDGLFITYHHNWYDHSDSRHPRVRFYTAHVYNNYYDGNSKYGIGATTGSSVFAENNYFYNCAYPMLISMQGSDVYDAEKGVNDYGNLATFSKESGGMIKAYNNIMVGAKRFVDQTYSTTEFDAIVVANRNDKVSEEYKVNMTPLPSGYSYKSGTTGYSKVYNNFDTASNMYAYNVDPTENVPAIVTANAGRLNGGDFKFDLSTADPESYAVNTELKTALTNYVSPVKSIGGVDVEVSVVVPTASPSPTTGTPVATTSTPVATTQTPTTTETPAGDVLISYDSASAVTTGITLAGTTAMGTANITHNTVKKSAIQLKNGYTVNDVVTNYIKLETNGGFKAGDVVTVAGFYNNSEDTKEARVCMFEVDGTKAAEPYFTSEKFINGRTSDAALAEQSYTLTKDMDVIYIGRVGNTTANVTLIKVTRNGAPAATTQTPATTETPVAPSQVPTTTETPVTPSQVPVEAKNGLVFEDNMWKYYVNNAVDTSYTGLVFYVDTYFYVTNGAVDFNYTGLAELNGFLFTVTNGVFDASYNTLVFHNGEWYNVINGFVDPNFTSLVYFGDAWFYVKNGKVDFGYTGLVEFGSAWFYINNGILDWSYTGLAELDGYLFNVKEGILDLSLSGVNNFNGTWYYLENGVVAKWYTSLAQYDGIWFYVNAGVLDFSYTGLVNFNGIWFYVTNGVLDTYYTGLTCYGGAWFYVTGGQLDWNYTGTCMYDGYNFAVVGGMVTGLA